jgi:hypothetical protein
VHDGLLFRAVIASHPGAHLLSQILWNQAIYQTVLVGKLMQAIFFGELRMIEVEVGPRRGQAEA